MKHWDYPNEVQRNNAAFLAISQYWLPKRRPSFQFRQASFTLAQAYSDAMRLFADELDAGGGMPLAAPDAAVGTDATDADLDRKFMELAVEEAQERSRG